MTTNCRRCTSDEDMAQVSLFILERKRDLHPSFSTLDIVGLLYSYFTQGHLLLALDSADRLIGVTAYYHGTTEEQFQDQEAAYVDIVIFDQAHRGTRLFMKGLRYLVGQIIEQHPQVREIKFAALQENDYLCRLYSKITSSSYIREGSIGTEIVFCANIHSLWTSLDKFGKLD